MTKPQYKNWKSEIAWLRQLSNKCKQHTKRFYKDQLVAESFFLLAEQLSSRANNLEKAKGTAQPS